MSNLNVASEQERVSGIHSIDFRALSDHPELDQSGQSFLDWDWECPFDDPFALDRDDDTGVFHEGSDDADGKIYGIDYFPVGNVDDEKDFGSSSYLPTESYFTPLKNLSDPRKERAKTLRQARLRVVSELDYDDPMQCKLVHLMRLRVKAILTKHADASTYLRWFFANEKDQHGLEFDLCAISLGADPTAVRLRFQRYFYLHWVIVSGRIADTMAQPPEEMLSKSTYYAGSVGADMMREAWEWPGIPLRKLIESAVENGYSAKFAYSAVEALQEKKYLLDWDENCYAVGSQGRFLDQRNPWSYR